MAQTDRPLAALSNDQLGPLRAALGGLAFSAYQAGENGLAFLADCDDVAEWIAVAMQSTDEMLAAAVSAALERRAEYDAALVAAERERWIVKCGQAYTEAHAMFDDYRDPANKHVRECIEWQLWRLRHDEIEMHDSA